jgi:hypothetical protein
MILVYVDFMNSDDEIPRYKKYLEDLNIKAKVIDDPLHSQNISAFTHVFMDYGGLNLPGNSLFEHTNEEVDELIQEHPSVEFIIISVMGKTYFETDLKNIEASNLHFMNDFQDEKELNKILNH